MSEVNSKTIPTVWLQVTAGQGPKECGWVARQVATRMLQEAEEKSLQAYVIESLAFDRHLRKQTIVDTDAWLSALLQIDGTGAKAFASHWCGSIKWHGESPYRQKHKRINWFVGVSQLEQARTSAVEQQELKKEVVFEAMRASGPGGQHVNKTNSAVRLTHKPTGITIRADSDRSQHRNKQLAMDRLIMIMELNETQNTKDQVKNRWMSHYEVSRGNPTRTFVGSDFTEKC